MENTKNAVHKAAQQGFEKEAQAYARGRPDYPVALSAWLAQALGLGPGREVADVGAGTGKFTALLATTRATVVGVEPVDAMRAKAGPGLKLALRSSAVGEDSLGVTFAGQYRSELNVPPEEACEVWKEIIASKYAVTAMSYRYQHGIPDDAAPMCVGVLAMVPAAAGGVAYSRDPVAASRGREQILLNAVPGLPQAVVDGVVTPDVYIFSRKVPPELIHKRLAGPEGTPPSLTDKQAADLAKVAIALEAYYTEPQDVEWALDAEDGRIVVLQSRPLREANSATEQSTVEHQGAGEEAGEAFVLADLPAGLKVLAAGGVAVSPGVGMGPVFVARKEADMLSFPQDGILVVERALPRWAPLLSRASGLVSETGGMAGHLASVAREYRLPALFSLPDACNLRNSEYNSKRFGFQR